MGAIRKGDGLRLTFDPALDAGGWPSPPGPNAAVFGEASVGEVGLLEILETALGLGGLHASALERAFHLSKLLDAYDGFWRDSFLVDPIATSRRLLADRDTLALWGWNGEPAGARLDALFDATRDALPGTPDRLRAILEALAGTKPPIERIALCSAIRGLPPLWQRLFARLRGEGVSIEEITIEGAKSKGDLRAARAPRFRPIGDGRIVLLRSHGPLAAADEIAGALAQVPSLEGVVIIGADAVLDRALFRLGLPRVGAERLPPGSTALVRLVLEAAFEPMDAADLHALAVADPGPVPKALGHRLGDALASFPGRRSHAWAKAMTEGLEKIVPERRARVDARVRALLEPAVCQGEALAADEITRRLTVLDTWARGRVQEEASLEGVIRMGAECRRLLATVGAPSLPRTALRRLLDDVERAGALSQSADAGLAHVADPGAVLAPARIVIWWNFTRARARAVPRLRLSMAERAKLEAAGVTPPSFGRLMEEEASRWRRPLDMASETLVLVCPKTDEVGERSFPHPLWDELVANMDKPELAALLERERLSLPAPPRRETASVRALPVAFDAVKTTKKLALRDPESASSLEKLLGCSLAWALDYHACLRPGQSSGPPSPNPLLFGTLAHEILRQVFASMPPSRAEAEQRATAILDRDLDGLAETLALSRYQVEHATVRRAIATAARELAEIVRSSGATLEGVELGREATVDEIHIAGRADMVLRDPDAVLDLKWGKSSSRTKLEEGSAVQLAVYAELFRRAGSRLEVAYFAIESQILMTEPGASLPGGSAPGRHTVEEIWNGVRAAVENRRLELAAGDLAAPGALTDDLESALAGGNLRLAPPCKYCDLASLCGRGGAR